MPRHDGGPSHVIAFVSVTGDSDVAKGLDRPYIPQELRAENLAALVFVDFVFVTTEPTAEAVLAKVKPDIYVKGCEYERSHDSGFLAEKKAVENYGGRISYSSGEIVFSSTKLIGCHWRCCARTRTLLAIS